MFTSRLADNLDRALTQRRAGGAGGHHVPREPGARGGPGGREPLRSAIVDAYANSLAPVFWYLVPILVVARLALVLKEVPLSEHAGMVARGEAVAAHGATDPDQRLSSSSRTPAARAR